MKIFVHGTTNKKKMGNQNILDVALKKSFINKRNGVGGRIEHCGTSTLIGYVLNEIPSALMASGQGGIFSKTKLCGNQ